MTIKDLITRNRLQKTTPARREEDHPFYTLQRQVNDLFDSFFRGGFDTAPFRELDEWGREFTPQIDIKEGAKEISVHAELPGMDEDDIEVLLTGNSLTLKGEKRQEKKEKDKNFWHVERRYGSFHRTIPLPNEIDSSKAKATFKKGSPHCDATKDKGSRRDGEKDSYQDEIVKTARG